MDRLTYSLRTEVAHVSFLVFTTVVDQTIVLLCASALRRGSTSTGCRNFKQNHHLIHNCRENLKTGYKCCSIVFSLQGAGIK